MRPLALALAIALVVGCKEKPSPKEQELIRPKAGIDLEPLRVRAQVPAIAYAAVTRDREIVASAIGEADVEAGRAASAETPFLAASIAKTIVATCVMQLVEEGRLDLDRDVTPIVGFRVSSPRYPSLAITTRMLLSHTASIQDDFGRLAPRAPVPLATFLKGYLSERGAWSDAVPGANVEYSNVGAALGALVVETIRGAPFEEVSRTKVFAPLAMRMTSWTPPPGHADGYERVSRGFVRVERPLPYPVAPAVELWSTPRDLGRFARAILRAGELDGARVLSAASVDAMLHEGRPRQALGWQHRTIGGQATVGHEGEDRGASTGLFLDRRRGVGAVVLANGDAFAANGGGRAQAIEDALAILLDDAAR